MQVPCIERRGVLSTLVQGPDLSNRDLADPIRVVQTIVAEMHLAVQLVSNPSPPPIEPLKASNTHKWIRLYNVLGIYSSFKFKHFH